MARRDASGLEDERKSRSRSTSRRAPLDHLNGGIRAGRRLRPLQVGPATGPPLRRTRGAPWTDNRATPRAHRDGSAAAARLGPRTAQQPPARSVRATRRALRQDAARSPTGFGMTPPFKPLTIIAPKAEAVSFPV